MNSGIQSAASVDHRQPRLGRSFGFIAVAVLASSLVGCGNDKPPSDVGDRLWVAKMPDGPRDRVDAFVLTEVGKRSVGSYYHGSMYRGAHDTFTWTNKGKDRGVIRLLQEERDYEVRIESCKPDKEFDQCILVQGDPKKVVRYQSRKRWAIPRRGKNLDVPALMLELAEDDDELESLLEE